jgi:hypothetical protein
MEWQYAEKQEYAVPSGPKNGLAERFWELSAPRNWNEIAVPQGNVTLHSRVPK